MLRNRVLGVSFLVLCIVVLLELGGLLTGLRLDAASRQGEEWARSATLDREFDALLVRAAGEGVSAFLTGSQAYAEEAREALSEARARFDALEARGSGSGDLQAQVGAIRELQRRMLTEVAATLMPLQRDFGAGSESALDLAERVYGYERLIPELRRLTDAFSSEARARTEAQVSRWRTLDDGLALARIVAMVLLVVAITHLVQRRVVAPLTALSDAAQKVRAGEFDKQVEVTSDDELGRLQAAFNQMMRRLGEYGAETLQRENELREALDRAESANQAKSAFVASISHELRTPMHGVLGTADLLLRGELAPEVRARIRTIRSSAEALLAIINDVLDLSKLEAGRMEMHFAPTNLRAMLAESLALVESRAMQRGLVLRADVAAEVPEWFLGDGGRLKQVLMNLLGNAVKFTVEGEIRFRAWLPQGGGDRLRFEVTDSGPGIPLEAQQRIFVPFEQADGSVSRSHGGTGLGLAISRMMVEAMDGWIKVDSEPGRGATFVFEISAPACAAPPSSDKEEPAASEGGYPGRVLVVEDHPVNQTLVEAMLDQLGCRCELAEDGRAAVTATQQTHYDLILMDCQMPEMDGYSATRAIRKREAEGQSRAIIVAMTAGAMQSDREAAQSAGMDDFLAKPFTVKDLRQVLDRWLRADG